MQWLADPPGLTPHGFCLLWEPGLIWTQALSDSTTGIAYVALSAALAIVAHKRRDLVFRPLFGLFAAFILLCGVSHWLDVLTLWIPAYWLQGGLKAATAAVSVVTAAATWALLPRALALASPQQFRDVIAALRRSESFLDRTGRAADVGGWEMDLVTGRLKWSDETCRIYGVPAGHVPTLEEAINHYAPEARPIIQAVVERGMAGGEPWDLELPFIRADGRRIWTRGVGSVEFDAGKPVRLVGAFQDVTERVAERHALQQANERLELALGGGRMGIWDWDIANDRMRWSAQQYRLYGLEPSDDDGTYRLWSRHLHPDDRAATEQAVADAVDAITPYDAEFRIIWGDGSVHHLRGNGRVTRDDRGRAVRMVGINWDVTEESRLAAELNARIVAQAEAEKSLLIAQSVAHRLEAEAAVQQAVIAERAAGRFRALLNAAPDKMLVVSPDGHISLANDRAIAVFGHASGDLVGQSIDRLIPRELWEAASRSGQSAFIAGTARRADGTEFPVEVSHSSFGFDREAGVIITIRDVTERRALEASLEFSRVQVAASARLSALGTMAGGIAHEINNPLAVIHGLAGDLKELAETGEASNDDVLTGTGRIVQYADRIGRIVRSLRYLARDGSRDPFDMASIQDIVAYTLDVTRERFRQSAIELLILPIEPDVRIACREVHISQILMNLLQNAFDAALGGDEPRWVRLEVAIRGTFVVFSVIDSGPGLAADIKAKIMEPFFTTKPVGKGTGLGLSLSKQMALEHSGKLEYCEQGANTCFSLHVPLHRESL